MREIKKVAVLTSGGDAPGMNACIRAVTRTAIYNGMKVVGVYRGYEGLMNEEFKEFTSSSVSNTIQRGGTILKTARSKGFLEPEGRKQAYDNMVKHNIDALIVIGGNGSLTGAQQFAREYDIPIIGLPGTIDNDLYGTDHTIGYDTALNTIVECVDKILHRTAPSLPAPKQPSSRKTRPMSTSWPSSSAVACARARTAPSSWSPKPRRTGSAEPCIMPTVSARSIRSSMCR